MLNQSPWLLAAGRAAQKLINARHVILRTMSLRVRFCFVLRASSDSVREDSGVRRRETCREEEQSFFLALASHRTD
jgi:hypothetical protein